MIKKINLVLQLIWFALLPMLTALTLITSSIILFVKLNDERAAIYINIACVYAVILLTGWLVNLIWSAIDSIIFKIKRKKKQ